MTRPLVIVGAGGFGRETLDVVAAINEASDAPVFEVLGVVDASPSDLNLTRLESRGVRWLGTEVELLAAGSPADFVVAIGSPAVREIVATKLEMAGMTAATLVHPSSLVGSVSAIGSGSIVCGGVHLSTNVSLGRHVHINPNATVGHDSSIADFVSINPGAIVSGDVNVGFKTLIGAGATILQGITLGSDVIVGASACVVRDVFEGLVVKGVPAR